MKENKTVRGYGILGGMGRLNFKDYRQGETQ